MQWSDELYRILGLTSETVQPTVEAFLEVLADQNKSEFFQLFELKQVANSIELQQRLLLPGGLEKYIVQKIEISHDAGDDITRFAGVVQDVTQLKLNEEKIWHQANFDPLTELANRNLFHDRCNQAVIYSKRHDRKGCLMFIDLDHFKTVNDTLGHEKGDKLLQQAADRLTGCVRAEDTVARVGGDEYTIILKDILEPDYIDLVSQKILVQLKLPFLIDGHDIHVSASIGIAIFPDHGDTVEALMRRADTAMYSAKATGRDRYRLYTQQMSDELMNRQVLELELRNALKEKQFRVYFQPIIKMSDNSLYGVEALVRWLHPERGIVGPVDFIPLAEETGLIRVLGERILRESCQYMVSWLEQGVELSRLSVNVSSVELREADFIERLEGILQQSGLSSEHLSLEITESFLLDAGAAIKHKLDAIRALGVSLSMDDFGTGFSSLSYLKHFPIDTLKIDRLFIKDMAEDDRDIGLVEAIILMADSLNLKIVAEGIETPEQHTLLKNMSCQYAQGYRYSKPIPAEQFVAWTEQVLPSLQD